MRQGRVFTATPKSTIQISRGFAVGIFSFLPVYFMEHGVGGVVKKLQLIVLIPQG